LFDQIIWDDFVSMFGKGEVVTFGNQQSITLFAIGLLITPRSGEALATAITLIDASNYKDYSKNALQSFSKFNSDIVFHKFIDAYLGR